MLTGYMSVIELYTVSYMQYTCTLHVMYMQNTCGLTSTSLTTHDITLSVRLKEHMLIQVLTVTSKYMT